MLVIEESDLAHTDTILATVAATILLSVYAHGGSARYLTDRYAAWYEQHPKDRLPTMESIPAPHQRWRRLGVASSPGRRRE